MLYKEITDWDTYLNVCTKRLKKAGMEISEYESTIKECYDLYIGHIDTINICVANEQTKLAKIFEKLNKNYGI